MIFLTFYLFPGTRQWYYSADTTKKMFSPGGVFLFYGRLFVSDWVGNRVLELSLGGTLVREVIKDNLEHPQQCASRDQKGECSSHRVLCLNKRLEVGASKYLT